MYVSRQHDYLSVVSTNYSLNNVLQVLLWRPAELLNGRLAMLGFVAAVANEAVTGASLWQQLYYAPYAFFSAYTLVVIAAQLNRAFGSPSKGMHYLTICLCLAQ